VGVDSTDEDALRPEEIIVAGVCGAGAPTEMIINDICSTFEPDA